jgi:hypothetical protein
MDLFDSPMERSPPSQAYAKGPIEDPKPQNANSESPNRNLASQSLTLQNCYITEVLAFPRSLAVFRQEIFHWNATCWLDFPIPHLAMRKISDHCNNKGPHELQICEFRGSSASSEEYSDAPDIRLLVVFPHMKSFKSRDVQRVWTDDIVLPSIRQHLDSTVWRYAPRSYELLRLESQAERLVLGRDVGDTPRCFRFCSDNLEGIWADIVSKTQQDGFEEFRGAFLVVLGKWHPTFTLNKSIEGAWKSLTNMWDWEINMDYVPADTLEVRMESQFGLNG